MLGVPPMSSLTRNSILETGISPLMLKARLMGSKTSSTTGVSATEELLEEDSGSELSEMLEELLLAGLEEATELEAEELTELETEELTELEELEELEELSSEPEEPGPTMSVMPLLFQTAVKVTSLLGAAIPVPGS